MRTFYWDAFLTSFCLRLPLLAVLLLVVGLVFLGFGEDYGAADLVYHDKPWLQFLGGVSLGLLVLGTLLVGFLLWNADQCQGAAAGQSTAPPAARAPDAAAPSAGREVAAQCLGYGLIVAASAGVVWCTSGAGRLACLAALLVCAAGLGGWRWSLDRKAAARAGARSPDWPFFRYACGILLCFGLSAVLLWLLVLEALPRLALYFGAT